MTFITGIYTIHAPASALNNGKGEDNTGQVKAIRVGRQEYPYVSAQAVRYWLRETLERYDESWQASPVYHAAGKKQQAYTEGDPIRYWDDDLLGYMRAEKGASFTRISPFRTSTLVSAGPVEIVDDFGVMGRGEGDFVLHGHEFYHATMVGAFSIDLNAVGTFTYENRSGYRNLSPALLKEAEEALEHLPAEKAYRMPVEHRAQRVASLLRAFGRLEGGAKQTLHYTDVSPGLVCMAVMRGGNNPFLHLFGPDGVRESVLDEVVNVYADDLVSGIYAGVRQGYAEASQAAFTGRGITVMHPREAFDILAYDVWQNPEWFK
jgi:CRISPR-associated protein Cst2